MRRRTLPYHAAPRARILVTLASLAIARPALAGPPLLTDDPETLPKGRFELNTAYTLTLSPRVATPGGRGRTWEQEAPIFDLNYGFAEGVQLKFELPLAVLDPADASARFGIGDLSLGCKLRLLNEDSAPVSLSIYPAFGVPLASSTRLLGSGSPAITLPVQIGHKFLDDRLFVYADAGYILSFAAGEPEVVFFGVATEYQVREGLVLCAELRHEVLQGSGSDNSLFNLGCKCSLSEHAAIIFSAGRTLGPSGDLSADLLLYAGVQWSF